MTKRQYARSGFFPYNRFFHGNGTQVRIFRSGIKRGRYGAEKNRKQDQIINPGRQRIPVGRQAAQCPAHAGETTEKRKGHHKKYGKERHGEAASGNNENTENQGYRRKKDNTANALEGPYKRTKQDRNKEE